MKRILCVALVFLTTSAFAQTASRDKVLQLYDTLQVRQNMQTMTQAMREQMVPAMMERLKQKIGPSMTAEDEQFLRQTIDQEIEEATGNGYMDQILDAMVPVYQKYYTDQDIDQLLAFYRTPTGQKFLTQQPAVMRDAMAAAQPIAIARMSSTMESTQKAIADYMQKKKSAPPAK